MVTSVLLRRTLPAVVAIAVAAVLLVVGSRAVSAAAGPQLLPDLVQEAPTGLVISRAGPRGRYVLGFRSAVSNVGDGPLIIHGQRPGTDVNTMAADQVVERDGGPVELVRDVGTLRYVVSPDHRHWHLLRFDRYELRPAGRRTAVVRDRKSGFCLGDRYATLRRAPGARPEPIYTSRCGLGEPQLLGVREGISVGWGDDYAANLEGQYLPLRSLPAGRYVLVHRVNVDRRLRELDYSNDAASVLLELRRRRGRPEIRLLRTCPHTARCDRLGHRPIG